MEYFLPFLLEELRVDIQIQHLHLIRESSQGWKFVTSPPVHFRYSSDAHAVTEAQIIEAIRHRNRYHGTPSLSHYHIFDRESDPINDHTTVRDYGSTAFTFKLCCVEQEKGKHHTQPHIHRSASKSLDPLHFLIQLRPIPTDRVIPPHRIPFRFHRMLDARVDVTQRRLAQVIHAMVRELRGRLA